jgi:hypothetical protein
MVESVFVLPLYVFLMLGILQLGLMHHARILTKYAAYKAVRVGALNNADGLLMERTALAVVLPKVTVHNLFMSPRMMTFDTDGIAFPGYMWNYAQVTGLSTIGLELPPATVQICGPLKGDFEGEGPEIDFDDPKYSAGDSWEDYQKTKLRIQVTFNYRMPIPFANRVIAQIALGQETARILMLEQWRTGHNIGDIIWDAVLNIMRPFLLALQNREYVLPIRANYNMRMQSNFYLNKYPLPEDNRCIVPVQRA